MEKDKRQAWQLLQARMRASVKEEEHPNITWKYVAGMDISFFKDSDRAVASISVCSWNDPKMLMVWFGYQEVSLTEPYIPQYLSFREAPHLINLWRRFESERPELARETGLILVDGNGVLHPKQFGLACYIGVTLNLPTIGVAKTLFHIAGFPSERELRMELIDKCPKPGDYVLLRGQPESRKSGSDAVTNDTVCLGAAVRATLASHRPIYVSVGHRMTISDAVRFVTHCCLHRIPEPIRQADLCSRNIVNSLQQHSK